MVISSIQNNNMAVIPQPAPKRPQQAAFAANNQSNSDIYSPVQSRKRGIGSFIFSFATFLAGAFGGDYAARKLIIKNKPMPTWKYMLIAIPFQLVGGSITQIIADKLFNKR